jgi:hypothetical protein
MKTIEKLKKEKSPNFKPQSAAALKKTDIKRPLLKK